MGIKYCNALPSQPAPLALASASDTVGNLAEFGLRTTATFRWQCGRRAERGTMARLLDRGFVTLPHWLHRYPSESSVHLLTHTLLFPADGLQVAGGCFQVGVPEP